MAASGVYATPDLLDQPLSSRRTAALSICCSKVPGLTPLRGAAKDFENWNRFLCSRGVEEPRQLRNPERGAAELKIKEFFKGSVDNFTEVTIVAFWGHGRNAFQTADTTQISDEDVRTHGAWELPGGIICADDLLDWWFTCKPKPNQSLFLLVDSCYSGAWCFAAGILMGPVVVQSSCGLGRVTDDKPSFTTLFLKVQQGLRQAQDAHLRLSGGHFCPFPICSEPRLPNKERGLMLGEGSDAKQVLLLGIKFRYWKRPRSAASTPCALRWAAAVERCEAAAERLYSAWCFKLWHEPRKSDHCDLLSQCDYVRLMREADKYPFTHPSQEHLLKMKKLAPILMVGGASMDHSDVNRRLIELQALHDEVDTRSDLDRARSALHIQAHLIKSMLHLARSEPAKSEHELRAAMSYFYMNAVDPWLCCEFLMYWVARDLVECRGTNSAFAWHLLDLLVQFSGQSFLCFLYTWHIYEGRWLEHPQASRSLSGRAYLRSRHNMTYLRSLHEMIQICSDTVDNILAGHWLEDPAPFIWWSWTTYRDPPREEMLRNSYLDRNARRNMLRDMLPITFTAYPCWDDLGVEPPQTLASLKLLR